MGRFELDSGMLVHDTRIIPVVDAVATVNESGANWSVALVNRHPSKEVACTVRMKGVPVKGEYAATVLAGDSPDAYNDVEHPARVVPARTRLTFTNGVVRLPPHSLTIVRIPREAAR